MANTTGKKYGGRKKGTPNKTTSETKQLLQNVVTKQIEKLETTLNKLDPVDRVNAISKLLPYILPKQNENVNMNTNTSLTSGMSEEERNNRLKELAKKILDDE